MLMYVQFPFGCFGLKVARFSNPDKGAITHAIVHRALCSMKQRKKKEILDGYVS